MIKSNQDILDLLSEGKSAKEVGKVLNMSRRTVEKRIENMKEIYNCSNIVQLCVKYAYYKIFPDKFPIDK